VNFVDTHCHLNFPGFQDDLQSVVESALAAGVTRIVVPGTDLASSQLAVKLAEKFPPIFAAVGIHPTDIESFHDEHLKQLSSLMHSEKVVAVGEIGLDYYHRQDRKDQQKVIFRKMLQLADEHNKPVILHSRNSLADLVGEIKNYRMNNSKLTCKGVFHAFEGNLAEASEVASLGFLIGAGGPVTYRSAAVKHQLFSKIELKYIVLETDAPFLAPQGQRGKRNEPANIPIIAEQVAQLQTCSLEEVAMQTTRNANLLFDWKE